MLRTLDLVRVKHLYAWPQGYARLSEKGLAELKQAHQDFITLGLCAPAEATMGLDPYLGFEHPEWVIASATEDGSGVCFRDPATGALRRVDWREDDLATIAQAQVSLMKALPSRAPVLNRGTSELALMGVGLAAAVPVAIWTAWELLRLL